MEKNIIENKLKSLYVQQTNILENIKVYANTENMHLLKREINSLIEIGAKLTTVEVMYSELRQQLP